MSDETAAVMDRLLGLARELRDLSYEAEEILGALVQAVETAEAGGKYSHEREEGSGR